MVDKPLTGWVRPARRGGKPVRGLWQLWVNLPPEPVFGEDGSPVLDRKGKPRLRYPRTTRTVEAAGRRAAERLLALWIAELEAHRCEDHRRLTVAVLMERWLEAIVHEVRPKTLDFYTDASRLHVTPALGHLVAAELRPSDLTRLYAAKRKTGLSETSLRHIHATVRAAYSWALREEILESNPAARVKNPPAQSRHKVETWSQGDVVKALALSRGLLVEVPLVLGAWAGLRVGEMCGLQWGDVDLAGGFLVVERAIEQTSKGLQVVPPKSEAGLRAVPLPAQAVDVLRVHRERQDELRAARRGRWNEQGWVMATLDGRAMSPDTISSNWTRFVKTRKLPRLTLHGLRHSYATDLFEHAVDGGKESMLKIVQERLGHADPATTARIYLHVTEQASDKARSEQELRIAQAIASAVRTAETSNLLAT